MATTRRPSTLVEPLPESQCIQQRLRGVLMRPVTGVDHRRSTIRGGRPVREPPRRTGCRVADDQRIEFAAAQLSAVSRSDSPLPTSRSALTLITSALIHLPATSNDTRVRVEFS